MGIKKVPAGHVFTGRPPVLSITKDKQKVLVWGWPKEQVRVFMHYTTKGSVPCLDEDCPYCPFPSTEVGYVDVLVPKPGKESGSVAWSWAVMMLRGQGWTIADKLEPGTVVQFYRKGKSDHGPIVYEITGNRELPEMTGVPLPLEERLLKLWALRSGQSLAKNDMVDTEFGSTRSPGYGK